MALTATSQAVAKYPERNITMLVPYGPGGLSDTMGRLMANALEKDLNATIAVVNKKGAAGTVGLTAVSRAKADGYTILMAPAGPLINQPHLRKLPYDISSFTYVCQFFAAPLALSVKTGSEFKSMREVIAFAKNNPDKLTYGTAGPGSIPHVSMIRLLMGTGTKMRHVPMAGDAGAAKALLGGHIDLGMLNTTTLAKNKSVQGMTIFADERSKLFPNLETAKEGGFDFSLSVFGGVIAPKGIPEEARKTLESACERITKTADFANQMKKLSTTLQFRGSAAFEKLVRDDFTESGKAIKSVGLGAN